MLKKLKRMALGAGVPHEKATATLATQAMPVPGKIVLSMQQHIGAPCNPVVKKGDTVMVGSLVGEASGFVSANIYSGVSGTVTGIETVRTSAGKDCPAVVIEADGLQTVDPAIAPPTVTDKESFLAAIKACGLVGLGGAAFPTVVKLSPRTPVDTLVINGAECEPYLTTDTREFLENSDTVISGIAAVMQYLEIANCVIGIERNKPECIDLMCSLVKGMDGVSVKALPSRYPQGAEKTLIETTLGREVPQGGLPSDIGAIVLNVGTVSTIGKFLATGMPLTSRRITVDGDAVAQPKNLEVIIGTPVREVMDFCGIKEGVTVGKVLMGGPMMGVAVADLNASTVKANNGLLVLSVEKATPEPSSACIRCGRCINGCPMGLSPVQLIQAYDGEDVEALQNHCIDLCVLCGTCSFVCPAKRTLTPKLALAKDFARKEANK